MLVNILYESDNYIVVNKPYDMYINSNNKDEKNTVCCHIASSDSHLSTSSNPLHFVQRLDYATSGVLCIAKNKKAAGRAGKLLQKRQAQKYYIAVLNGHVEKKAMDITYDIGEDVSTDMTNHKMVSITTLEAVTVSKHRRKAETRLLLLEHGYYDGHPASVVLLKPTTGRRHQLRVHCSSIGHTILGDYTYDEEKNNEPHRMFLHATRLVLPMSEESLDIQTNEPFFNDELFTEKWTESNILYKYKTKEQFLKICDIIDDISVDCIQCFDC